MGPLHGLPVSLKDQIPIKGLETTMGIDFNLVIECFAEVAIRRLCRLGGEVCGRRRCHGQTSLARGCCSIREDELGTQIHLEESGLAFPQADGESVLRSLRSLAQGWTLELDELVRLVESE